MQVALKLARHSIPTGIEETHELHKALLQKVAQSGDRDAFEALFSHFAPRIKALMIKSGSVNSEAEDIAQDVMLKVWRKSALYAPGKGAVSTWVFAIARNSRIDRLRKKSSVPYDDIDDIEVASNDVGAEEEVLATQQALHVAEAISQLPGEQRNIIDLAFVHDMSQSEIAMKLSLPLGTVKSRMRLAYDKLRLNLEYLK